MRELLFVATLVIAEVLFYVDDAKAVSCTELLNQCIKGNNQRGNKGTGTTSCVDAHPSCLQTGVWQTYGPHGRTLSNVDRR